MAIGIPYGYGDEPNYFPAIAQQVGEGPPTAPTAPLPTGRAVPNVREVYGPPVPPNYYPLIADLVGGGESRSRVRGAEDYPVPPIRDIGPGVAIPPSDTVTSVDLAPQAAAAGPNWAAILAQTRFRGVGPAPGIPMAGMPAPGGYVTARPEFIYTNPAAAQQAASNYAQRLQFNAAEDQGYRDYLSRIAQTRSYGEAAAQQNAAAAGMQQAQLEALRGEGAASRASNERVAAIQEALRQFRMEEALWAQNERNADIGERTAAMLNADPLAKVDRKWAFLNPATGKWEPAFRRQPHPIAPYFGPTGPTAPPAVPPAPVPTVPYDVAAPVKPATPAPGPSLAGKLFGMSQGLTAQLPGAGVVAQILKSLLAQ